MGDTLPRDDTEAPAATRVEFLQYHRPPLVDGDYRITVKQTVKIRGKIKPSFDTSRAFTVQGPRCSLDPTDVHAVFPPEGSLGDHSNVLPHIVLDRSTLPWERRPHPDLADRTWLALLLFDDAEKPEPKAVTLGSLRSPVAASPWWPGLSAETGEDPTVNVTVIDVKKTLLRALLPTDADLSFLAHVRRGIDDSGATVGDELSIVIGNRTPARGALSTVHLISLDRRFRKEPQSESYAFDFQQAGDDDAVRLVSLKSWSFACADAKQTLAHLLKNLDPYRDGKPTGRPATLRLPLTDGRSTEAYLSLGLVPLPHALREGSTTISWYRGPLSPRENNEPVTLPVRAADELVRYNPADGFFDVSYAAAWELGRLLTLRSKQASTSLFAWKRARAHDLLQAERHLLHLPFAPKEVGADDLEKIVDAWFDGLGQLQGIPFNYLVPDARMLPPESIRFFSVDPRWVDCLIDGAFSIGRVTTADFAREGSFTEATAKGGSGRLTGLLLRSDAVSGWPGLRVTARVDGGGDDVEPLRMDLLGPNVLIALFKDRIVRVSIHEKPETLHFGLDPINGGGPGAFAKKLRDANGVIPESGGPAVAAVGMRDKARRVLDVAGLAGDIGKSLAVAKIIPATRSLDSALFALQMVEGAEAVVFQAGSG